MLDRRQDQRYPAYLGGIITFSYQFANIDCLIRNRSQNGMRIHVYNTGIIPEYFHLAIPCRQSGHRVRVCWRRFEVMGVEIASSSDDVESNEDPPVLRRLKLLRSGNERRKRRPRGES